MTLNIPLDTKIISSDRQPANVSNASRPIYGSNRVSMTEPVSRAPTQARQGIVLARVRELDRQVTYSSKRTRDWSIVGRVRENAPLNVYNFSPTASLCYLGMIKKIVPLNSESLDLEDQKKEISDWHLQDKKNATAIISTPAGEQQLLFFSSRNEKKR